MHSENFISPVVDFIEANVSRNCLDMSRIYLALTFSLFRKDRTAYVEPPDAHEDADEQNHIKKRRGGGVAIYVKNRLRVSEVSHEPLRSISERCEVEQQLWVQVKAGERETILLGCIYRPPFKCRHPDDKTKHEQAANRVNAAIGVAANAVDSGLYNGLCIVGDFNYPDISWNDQIAFNRSNESSLASRFLDTINSSLLYQAVGVPTFFSPTRSVASFLDLIIAEKSERVDVISVGPPLGSSTNSQGHGLIEFTINHRSTTAHTGFRSNRLNYARGNYSAMARELQSIDWQTIIPSSSIDEAYDSFCNIYNNLCEKYVPSTRPQDSTRGQPWMTRELYKLGKLKAKLWHDNKLSSWQSASKVRTYRRISRRLDKLTRSAIVSHERQLAFDKNQKKLFAYVKRKQTVITSIAAVNTPNGTAPCPSEIANVLNEQFASVFIVESAPTALEIDNPNLSQSLLQDVDFTVDDLTSRLSKLDSSKSTGVDGIHPRVLKECAAEFAKPLKLIYELSLRSGCIPRRWKLANVTPLFKKGSRLEPCNYRPISLTSIPCKVMESVIRQAMMLHLHSNRLTAPEQHGFTPKRACNTNLLETTDLITSLTNEGHAVDVIFLDFAKAFDKVPHKRLILKLQSLGISGNLISWLRDFLNERRQRVVLGEHSSDWVTVTSGVP